MRRSLRCISFALTLSVLSISIFVSPLVGQQEGDEPILDEVRALLSTPGLTFGFLLQTVVDAGLEEDPTRTQIANARLRFRGRLDGGFSYLLQTNHVATPSLLDARVSWSSTPALTISAGRFKTPFSREFLVFVGSIDFVNRSRVVTRLAPNRQVGVQLDGRLDEVVSWSVGGFTGSRSTTADESLIGVARLQGAGIEVGEEGVLTIGGNVAGGRESAVGARALGAGFAGDGVLFGLDARYESGSLMLNGEYIRGDWEPSGGGDVESDGFFLTAGYMMAENQQALVRWDRFSAPGADADDMLVLGFNAWPTSATEIQANWQIPLNGSDEIHKVLINFQIGI